jgi:hypothetical protein
MLPLHKLRNTPSNHKTFKRYLIVLRTHIVCDVIIGVRVARVLERQLLTALDFLDGVNFHHGASLPLPQDGLTRGLARVE